MFSRSCTGRSWISVQKAIRDCLCSELCSRRSNSILPNFCELHWSFLQSFLYSTPGRGIKCRFDVVLSTFFAKPELIVISLLIPAMCPQLFPRRIAHRNECYRMQLGMPRCLSFMRSSSVLMTTEKISWLIFGLENFDRFRPEERERATNETMLIDYPNDSTNTTEKKLRKSCGKCDRRGSNQRRPD